MEKNNILNADVLDIIFDGRNKQYGAYELRKTYNKRLKTALAVMLFTCLLVIVGSVLANNSAATKISPIFVQDYSLTNVREEPPKQPVIPPKVPELPRIKQIDFTPPKIVQEEVKTPPPTQNDLEDTKISTINVDGVKSDVVAPPVEDKGTGTVVAPKTVEDYEHEFHTVQVQASFPGGMDEWVKYLRRNLRAEVATDAGAPTGKYTVVVSFLVDKDGNISEVKAENDPGYGTADEAIRVVKKSGKWIAAIQNGRNVIYRQRQPVTFAIDDSQ